MPAPRALAGVQALRAVLAPHPGQAPNGAPRGERRWLRRLDAPQAIVGPYSADGGQNSQKAGAGRARAMKQPAQRRARARGVATTVADGRLAVSVGPAWAHSGRRRP